MGGKQVKRWYHQSGGANNSVLSDSIFLRATHYYEYLFRDKLCLLLTKLCLLSSLSEPDTQAKYNLFYSAGLSKTSTHSSRYIPYGLNS